MADFYSVLVVARGPGEADPAALDVFLDALQPWHPSVGGGEGEYSARITIEADSPALAATDASDRVRRHAGEAGLPPWPHVAIEATREDVLDDELARPLWPDLVSTPEIAEILDVSQSRVRLLASNNKRFPAPAYELRTGKIWLRSAIERFAETWERKPGRPKTAAASSPVEEHLADLLPVDAYEESVMASDASDADKLDMIRRHRDRAQRIADAHDRGLRKWAERHTSKTPAE